MSKKNNPCAYTFWSIISSTPRSQDQTPIPFHRKLVCLLPKLRNHQFFSCQMIHLYNAGKQPTPLYDLLILTAFFLSTLLAISSEKSKSLFLVGAFSHAQLWVIHYVYTSEFILQTWMRSVIIQMVSVEGLVPGTAVFTHGDLRKWLDAEGYQFINGLIYW